MNKDKVTIHDVARAANVSPATVSRVLNNSDHPVKPELKEKILLASKQLGYILTAWKQEGSSPLTPASPGGLNCLKPWKL